MNKYTSNTMSVGVPTYNQGDYIRATLDSLLKQTLAPLEIVVCNNHSTDNTAEILKDYEGKVRVIQPETHLDMMDNWNYLVSQLKGDWFTLLSSDDLAHPNYVKTLVEGTTRSTNAVLIRAGWENIDNQGAVLEKRYLLSVATQTRPPQTFLENLYGPKSSFAAFAVKKSAWEKIGGFSTECKLYGDWAFWLRLSPLGDFIYEHKIITGYRTAYRPGIELKRLSIEIRDEEVISTVIIPETAKKIGNINQELIDTALKVRFISRLDLICRLIKDGEVQENQRTIYAEELLKWALSVNCLAELNEFKAGKNFVAKASPVKALLRKVIHLIRS
ncbi:MAG: glycosyltransferase [Methylococcaceae bacterium]